MAVEIPDQQVANHGSTITIEELEATFPGGKLRKLVLVGSGLPRRGAVWGGEMRAPTTWYTGNGTEGSQQILGPTETPSSWTGMWKRTTLGRAPCIYTDEAGTTTRIVDPTALWQIMDDFRIAGPRLRVTWQVLGVEIVGSASRFGQRRERKIDFQKVMEGRLTSFAVNPDRHTDIQWNATFTWISRGGKQSKVAEVRQDDDVSKITQSLQDAFDNMDTFTRTAAIVSSNARIPNSASKLTLGRLEAIANAPRKAITTALSKLRYDVNQVKRAADLAKTLQSTPQAIESSVLDFARDVQAVANQTVDEFGRRPAELNTNKRKVSDLLRAQRYFGNVLDGMNASAVQASELELRLKKSKASGANRGQVSVRDGATTRAGMLIAIHVCKKGDTPNRVSTKYYLNPDQGADILRANRLPGHTATFVPGQILVIPALDGRQAKT
jgi:hypothetical protein